MPPANEPIHLAFLGNGQCYHVQKWLPALVEQGLRVTLITFHPPAHQLEGVAVQVLTPPFSSSPERMSWIDFCGPTRSLRQMLDALKVDVLMPSYATNYGWMAFRTGFRPQIVNTWTYDVSVYPMKGWKRLVFRPVVRRVLRRADLIFTDGAALAEFVREHYTVVPERVVPVFWGIRLADHPFSPEMRDEARNTLGIPPEVPVIISARGVSDWYSPIQVLTAFRRLLDARPDLYVLVLTLTHERTSDVQALLDELAKNERAHVFDRFLTKPEMCQVWAASDVLISVPPHDGISVGVLEGMYAGALPVVSDIPSNRSFLPEDRAFYIQTDSPDELEATLGTVLDGLPGFRERIAPANRAWVAEHGSVEATARQVAARIRNLGR